jgi:hypothetical protein
LGPQRKKLFWKNKIKIKTPHSENPIAKKRGKTFDSLFAVLVQQFFNNET